MGYPDSMQAVWAGGEKPMARVCNPGANASCLVS
jgi:hypothetical protein